MDRRSFLAAMSAAPLWPRPAADPAARIAISTWSLHPYFKSTHRTVPGTPPQASGDLKLTDFFALIRDRYGVTNYEVVNVHFDSRDPAYLAEVRAALAKVNGKIYNMPCDIAHTNLGDEDDAARATSVAAVKQWIDVAVVMGSPSIRCNTGRSRQDANNLAPAVRSYKELAAYGAERKIRVTIENHEGISTDMVRLKALLDAVNDPNLGTCPDFGNTFKTEEARHAGLTMMFPYAKICHAKSLKFNEKGEHISFDFPACVALAEKLGYQGVYSIEFEGDGDPMQGVAWTLALLKKALA